MARPKKSSNYKVIQDIDLSKNNIYNVNAIVGNSYDFEPNDLIITTYDTDADPTNLPSNAGNLILRAGVADKDLAYSGSVHIFAGNEVEPNEDSTVLDTLASSVYSPLNGKSSRVKNGITVDPDEGVFIKSEILVDSEADTKTGTVSIEANKNLKVESKDKTTFNSPNVKKTVTTETDEIGTLTETFTTEHTETANKLNIYAGSVNPSDATLTLKSNYKNEAITGDTEHSYINVDEIVVDKTVTEGTNTARVVRTTYTSSDTNLSDSYKLYAGSSNLRPDSHNSATLTVESNYKNEAITGDTEHSYINVDEIVVDETVTEGTKTDRVDRTVFATTDTTDVSESLKIDAPEFALEAGNIDGTIKSSLEVTDITSTNNYLENLKLGREIVTPTGGKSPTGSFVVDNNSVDIDTNTLSINVPNNLHEDNPTGGTVFELSANTSSSMHIDEVKIDDKLLIGEEVVKTDSATGKESTSIKKSTSAEIYTNKFVLNTEEGDTGLSITGKNALEITDHKEIPSTGTPPKTESYINVNHIEVGTVDVVTDKANDVIVYNSIKTDKTTDRTTNTDKAIDVILTGDSDPVSYDKGATANKIHDVEINSETINIKGGSTDSLHITSYLTENEANRLNTKGLDKGDSFIETDDLRVNKNFYANQFYIYWDDRINSLVFANSEQTPKG